MSYVSTNNSSEIVKVIDSFNSDFCWSFSVAIENDMISTWLILLDYYGMCIWQVVKTTVWCFALI